MIPKPQVVVDPLDAVTGVGPEGSNLLTLAESGEAVRRGTTFIRGEVRAGRLTTTRIGRTPYIERAELARYIAEHRETGADSARPEMTPRRFRDRGGRRPVHAERPKPLFSQETQEGVEVDLISQT